MATCAGCGSSILFGGKTIGEQRFCNDKCLARRQLAGALSQIPETLVREQAAAIHSGPCPKCKGKGPVDVHLSHSIWSFVILTQYKSTPHICCRSCATKSQAIDAVSSLVVGWWGIPWGILMTPVQIGKNIVGMTSGSTNPAAPSPELIQQTRLMLASAAARQSTR